MPRYIPRFKRAKQISEILPEVLSEKNLEIPRPELKAFFTSQSFLSLHRGPKIKEHSLIYAIVSQAHACFREERLKMHGMDLL